MAGRHAQATPSPQPRHPRTRRVWLRPPAPTPSRQIVPHSVPAALYLVRLSIATRQPPSEILVFLSEWLSRDPDRLAASLAEFVGHPAYGLNELHGDLERFVFLLGGSDGRELFGL